MTKFHCIGMKETSGKGKEGDDYSPENHAAMLLYLEKTEGKIAKWSRERFLKAWDKELIRLGNSGDSNPEMDGLVYSYQAGRNGDINKGRFPDMYDRGFADAARNGRVAA